MSFSTNHVKNVPTPPLLYPLPTKLTGLLNGGCHFFPHVAQSCLPCRDDVHCGETCNNSRILPPPCSQGSVERWLRGVPLWRSRGPWPISPRQCVIRTVKSYTEIPLGRTPRDARCHRERSPPSYTVCVDIKRSGLLCGGFDSAASKVDRSMGTLCGWYSVI